MRKTTHGFLLFVSAIVFVIIVIMSILANNTINQRYGLKLQDPLSTLNVGAHGSLAESYTN